MSKQIIMVWSMQQIGTRLDSGKIRERCRPEARFRSSAAECYLIVPAGFRSRWLTGSALEDEGDLGAQLPSAGAGWPQRAVIGTNQQVHR